MDFTRKIVLLSLLFLTVGILIFYSGYASKEDGRANYATKNLKVKGWQLKSIQSSQAVLDSLQADTTIFADYSQPGIGTVNLYIGYYNTLDKSKMSHAPQVCFTAQGWVMEKNDKVNITLGGKTAKVNRLFLEKNKEQILVYYWYQSGNKVYSDLYRMKLSLLGKKLQQRGRVGEGNAFVRISTSTMKNKELSSIALKKFAVTFFEEFTEEFNPKNSNLLPNAITDKGTM